MIDPSFGTYESDPDIPVSIPDESTMYRALLEKDANFEGIFFAAIKTTGIFCRPTCTARKPKRENVVFYSQIQQAILDGYRPCKICKPMEPPGTIPEDIRALLNRFHSNPGKRIRDMQIREMNLDPARVRRCFQKHYGMTFHAYQRMYRLNHAFSKLRSGESVLETALDAGYNSLSGFNDMFKNLTGVTPKKGREIGVIHITRLESPLGQLVACATEDGICLLEFYDRKKLETELTYLVRIFHSNVLPGENPHLEQLTDELEEYFAGKRKIFTVPLLTPGTDFQQSVWAELQKIPYGTTRSYLDQAKAIGCPKGVRAVANANGMNRIAILIPCHRIIGNNGELRGYGGGVWRKRRLIDWEQQNFSSGK